MMSYDRFRIEAYRNYGFSDDKEIALHAIGYTGKGKELKFFIAEPMEMKEHPVGSEIKPFYHLDKETAQHLMDTLWRAGLRPTKSTGVMIATQKHLEDLRTLVFDKGTK